MGNIPKILPNGTMPSGYVLGRTVPGSGPPHLISMLTLVQKLIATGGVPGPQGKPGINGINGFGVNGYARDGEDGADAPIIPGPRGADGLNGLTIPGRDGEDGDDGGDIARGALNTPSAAAASANTTPLTSQSAAYTLKLTDANSIILHPSADTTARVWTIDSNANVQLPVGTFITFINQDAAGVITIAITTDTMRLAGAGTTGSRTLAANGVATATKITATEWIITGVGLT